MEYRVLSRKWRPQTFEHVIGQDHVVKTLTNAIQQNRIAHAFIFSGPRGVGKTSIARIFAKALNCEKGPTDVPCNVCTNCLEITESISIDVHEIDGASNRGIDEIRELRESVKFSPVSSRYKIYIIDEVHMLTREAFNALLKTLEEPPPHVIFIFATTEAHKVPATILSRCQCFDFRRISLKQISDNLRKIGQSEKFEISDSGLMWIAEAADGSARDAQSILDQVISYSGVTVPDKDIQDLLGFTDRRFLYLFSEAVLKRNAADCLKAVEEAYYAGVDMKFFYQMLLNHFRNLLLLKILGDCHGLVDITQDEMSKMENQIKSCSRETLQRHLDILMAEEDNVRKSPNPRLNLEAILVKMAYMEPVIPIETILSRIETIEKSLSVNQGPTEKISAMKIEEPVDQIFLMQSEAKDSKNKPSEDVDQTTGSYNHLDSPRRDDITNVPYAFASETFPKDFLNFVRKRNPRLSSKIEPGRLSYEEGCLTIVFPAGYFFLEDIKQMAQKEQLTAIAESFFKKSINVKIESIDTVTYDQQKKKNQSTANINELKREALQDPLLQKVLDVFSDAEVKEVLNIKNHQSDV
ncbi:MAG: DNA polymerase III subunit gamma/tau [Deltaproteobacteria bacterium]|nr:DNA polymerase III subunit gamma/tau [Deltaproteobacteria bacterium]